MTEHFIEFLIDRSGKSPKNLNESIRKVMDASAGFTRSWQAQETHNAYETSQEAFGHLDFIQNEILRQRDVHKKSTASWYTSPFYSALSVAVGNIVTPVSSQDRAWFLALPSGAGSLPPSSTSDVLTLEQALNKLKHRDTVAINFSISQNTGHSLFILTNAGMGKLDSISTFNIISLCSACRAAASHI